VIKTSSVKCVIVDTTVMEQAIAYPTNSRLLERCREHQAEAAAQRALKLRQNYNRGERQGRQAAPIRRHGVDHDDSQGRAVAGARSTPGNSYDGCTLAEVESAICHMKTNPKLDWNWLKGALGNEMRAVLSGAGRNLRMILPKLRFFYVLMLAQAGFCSSDRRDRSRLVANKRIVRGRPNRV
jgi:hypothetical protein